MAGLETAAAYSPVQTPRTDDLHTVRSHTSNRSHTDVNSSIRIRFTVAVLVMITMGLMLMFAHGLLASKTNLFQLVGCFLVAFICLFGYEWCWVHANALTRQKRAHFDEANILETYQPRARSHGHLFHPDPPTPGPIVKIQEGDIPERSPAEKAAFNANRDAHYANMFEYAMRVAKEQEAMEKTGQKGDKEVNKDIKEVKEVKESAKVQIEKNNKDKSVRMDKDNKSEVTARSELDTATARGEEKNDKGEPLYENISPMDIELPKPPRPSATEQIQAAAKKVASTVRTALESTDKSRH